MKVYIKKANKDDVKYTQAAWPDALSDDVSTLGFKTVGTDGKEYGGFMYLPTEAIEKLREYLNEVQTDQTS